MWLRGLCVDGMTDQGNLGVDDHVEENDDPLEDSHDFPVVVPDRISGNWRERMENAQSTLSLFKVLQRCEDFANEPHILQDVIQLRGHLCRFCVKYFKPTTTSLLIVLYSCNGNRFLTQPESQVSHC